MNELNQTQQRQDSMRKIIHEFDSILEHYKGMLAGFLPEAEIDIYDTFMDQEGYVWSAEKNEYVLKPVETDVRPIRWISS